MQAITQYLSREGYNVVSDSYYSKIDLWLNWYKGKVWQFHNYKQYNGSKTINRTRKSLGMAKRICEDWANLELNEKVDIVVDDEASHELVQDVLMVNNFRVRGNQLLELSYALGTGAFVEYLEDNKVYIDYIRAGMIYPLNWDNGEITECAFASERVQGKQKLIYLNIHELGDRGTYIVKNRMFTRNGNTLSPTELPEGMAEEYNTGSYAPMFQIIKPNIVNNVDLDCPMGISVYANALDQLEGLDLVYDSYCNEFRLGKKRIMVPISLTQVQQVEAGLTKPLFDDNDTEFYAVDMESTEKPYEINMELRAEAHELAIKTSLNLLASKCGLGNDRYNFEKGGIKTATEVISEKSDLFQNLKKHELILEKALIDMVKAILVLSGKNPDVEISVKFDDSIIEDTATKRKEFLQEISLGLRQRWEYRVEFLGESEEEAKKQIEEIKKNEPTVKDLLGVGDVIAE